MELEEVGIECGDDVGKLAVRRIDGERDAQCLAFGAPRQATGLIEPEVPGAARIADEADKVGSGGERSVERFDAVEAADFDERGHLTSLSSTNRSDLRYQLEQVLGDRMFDDVEIDAPVRMDEPVAQGNGLHPMGSRIARLCSLRADVVQRLADHDDP